MFKMHLGHRRERIVAVADVESGSVAIAIVALQAGTPARVVATERAVLPFEERSEDATITGIAAQLVAAGEKVQKTYAEHIHGAGPVSELFVIFHAPWARSKTLHATTLFKGETLITDRMISELAQKMIAETPGLDKKNLLEANVIRIELNGYPCVKPADKHATQLSIFALLSETTASIRTGIESALQKIFPHLSPTFCSATRASISVLREIADKEKAAGNDCLIINMASGATTLTAVREGVAVEHELVLEGSSGIVKRIATNGMPEETLTMIRMLAHDQCSSPACSAISASITRIEPELVRIFGESVGKCAAERRLPNTLILIAHPDLSPWLSKFFSRIDFAQFTLSTQPFLVWNLEASDLANLVRPGDGVDLDSGLALVSGLVNIEKSRSYIV